MATGVASVAAIKSTATVLRLISSTQCRRLDGPSVDELNDAAGHAA
jgi:hypothetical protein